MFLVEHAPHFGIDLNKFVRVSTSHGDELNMGLYATRTAIVLETYLLEALVKARGTAPDVWIVISGLGLCEFDCWDLDVNILRAFTKGLVAALRSIRAKIVDRTNVVNLKISGIARDLVDPRDYLCIINLCEEYKWVLKWDNRVFTFNPRHQIIACFDWDPMSYIGNQYWRSVATQDRTSTEGFRIIAATLLPFTGTPEVNPEGYKRFFVHPTSNSRDLTNEYKYCSSVADAKRVAEVSHPELEDDTSHTVELPSTITPLQTNAVRSPVIVSLDEPIRNPWAAPAASPTTTNIREDPDVPSKEQITAFLQFYINTQTPLPLASPLPSPSIGPGDID
jgi:hypothetical protein